MFHNTLFFKNECTILNSIQPATSIQRKTVFPRHWNVFSSLALTVQISQSYQNKRTIFNQSDLRSSMYCLLLPDVSKLVHGDLSRGNTSLSRSFSCHWRLNRAIQNHYQLPVSLNVLYMLDVNSFNYYHALGLQHKTTTKLIRFR